MRATAVQHSGASPFLFFRIRARQRRTLGNIQHLIIDIIRIMEGLILYRDTYPGGPISYFSNVSQWTFVTKNYLFTAQTLIGDGVVVSFGFVHMHMDLIH